MTEQTIKKKVDLGAIAFMRVNKLTKEVEELRKIVEKLLPIT